MNLNKKQQADIVMVYALGCVNQEPEDQMLGQLADMQNRPSKSLSDWTSAEATQLNRRVCAFIDRYGFKCDELKPRLRILINWYGEEETLRWFHTQQETAQ